MAGKVRVAAISMLIVRLVFPFCFSQAAHARPPDDVCSLLPVSQLEKTLGRPYSAPAKTKAPPAFPGQSWGANCRYAAQNGGDAVVFIVYTDGSASEAKQTFEKLTSWFGAKSNPAIGDSAYIDSHKAIHVLKGKVRYYLGVGSANEKQLKELATLVAGQI